MLANLSLNCNYILFSGESDAECCQLFAISRLSFLFYHITTRLRWASF